MSRNIFIAGTGTDVGKTIVAAIITQKLEADYWKPIQAGNLYDTDTMTVQRLVSNAISSFHHETYRLQVPASPHDAASQEEIRIDEDAIKAPQTDQALIIEGAGGLMVPLNEQALVIDLIKKFNAEVVLVAQNYLGSINHTILSIEALKQRNIPVTGILFNGRPYPSGEDFITGYTGISKIGNLAPVEKITPNIIDQLAPSIQNLD